MPQKKEKKEITNSELAILINNGFQNMEDRFQGMESRIGGIEGKIEGLDGKIEGLESEMREGFRAVQATLGQQGRRIDYHDDVHMEIKSRLKVVEKKLDIKPSR